MAQATEEIYNMSLKGRKINLPQQQSLLIHSYNTGCSKGWLYFITVFWVLCSEAKG